MSNERKNRNEPPSEPQSERATPRVADAGLRVPASVNLHLEPVCNYHCRFCYFTEAGHLASLPSGAKSSLSIEDVLRLQKMLAEAGVERLTYAGGEPTLSAHLERLVLHWHELHGADRPRAMIVTNGSALYPSRLRRIAPALAAVKLSVDSVYEEVEVALGRGYGNHIATAISRADTLHELGIRVDLNSVICRLNLDEDLTPLVRRIAPRYWKVFQMLPVPGQNDLTTKDLEITAAEFGGFCDRHAHLSGLLVPEDNDMMRSSYAMIDPVGRFFQSTPEGYVRSPHSVLEVGVEKALSEIPLDWEKYDARGGDERAFGDRSGA